MRLFTLLKNTITVVKSTYSLMTDGSTLEDGYVVLPNGFKVCWGMASGLRNGGSFTVPVAFTIGAVYMLPWYNTGTTMRCTFAAGINGQTVSLNAYDVTTKAISTQTNLSVIYFIIGF